MADVCHIERVRSQLIASGIDAMLIKSGTMKKYLRTLTGSGCKVLVTLERAFLILDGRYVIEAREREHDLEFIEHAQGADYLMVVQKLLNDLGASVLGVEADQMSVGEYLYARDLGIDLVLLDDEIPLIRIIKDGEEIAAVERACRITDEIYEDVLAELHLGMTECEISALLHYHALRRGAQRMSFDVIVGSGPRSALPHGRPTMRAVREHEADRKSVV